MVWSVPELQHELSAYILFTVSAVEFYTIDTQISTGGERAYIVFLNIPAARAKNITTVCTVPVCIPFEIPRGSVGRLEYLGDRYTKTLKGRGVCPTLGCSA